MLNKVLIWSFHKFQLKMSMWRFVTGGKGAPEKRKQTAEEKAATIKRVLKINGAKGKLSLSG